MHNSYAKSYVFRRHLHRGKKSSAVTLHALRLTVRMYVCTVKARTPCMICCLCNEGFLDGLSSNDDSKFATKTQPKYLPIFFSSFTKSTSLESEAIVCAFPITGLSMAVPLTRNAFAENRPDLFVVLSKRSENVLFSFFLHKATKRYSFRKIFAVLTVILRLQKRGTEFLGNDHQHSPKVMIATFEVKTPTFCNCFFVLSIAGPFFT